MKGEPLILSNLDRLEEARKARDLAIATAAAVKRLEGELLYSERFSDASRIRRNVAEFKSVLKEPRLVYGECPRPTYPNPRYHSSKDHYDQGVYPRQPLLIGHAKMIGMQACYCMGRLS